MRYSKGFTAVEALLILVIVGILGFTGWYVWNSKQDADKTSSAATQASSSSTSTAETVPAGYTKYENQDLGFSFLYPKEWGDAKYEKKVRNREDFEPIKSHFVTFSKSETVLVISPDDWKFTGGASEWDFPRLHERDFAKYKEQATEDNTSPVILNTSQEFAYIFSSNSFDGNVNIEGVKLFKLSKLNSSSIELRRSDGEFDQACLDAEGYATLKCFSEVYRNQFIKVIQSIKSL